MNITEIKIRRTYNEGRFRALVSITVDNDLAVHDIKVIEGPERFFVAMPSRREENGVFRDVVHPITAKARQEMEDLILEEYYRYKKREDDIQEEQEALRELQESLEDQGFNLEDDDGGYIMF